jgi:hypothetical protein
MSKQDRRPKANTAPAPPVSIAEPIKDGEALVDKFKKLRDAVFTSGSEEHVRLIHSDEYPKVNGQGLHTRLFSLDERMAFSKFIDDNGGMINSDAAVNRSIVLGISNDDGKRIFDEDDTESLKTIESLHPLFRLELWRKIMEFNDYLDPPKQVAAKKSEKTES